MNKAEFDHLVLAAPTVDISNLETANIKPTDNTDRLKKAVSESCKNLLRVAEDALRNHPDLKNVTVMSHTPRYDTVKVDPVGLKSILANFANNYFLELWLDSPLKDKIFIGSHNLECSGKSRTNRYTDKRTGRYDGVHMYGRTGAAAYTESVVNILMSSFQSGSSTQQNHDDSHRTCPQTKHKQKRTYSSVVGGRNPIKTHNRFSPLGNC